MSIYQTKSIYSDLELFLSDVVGAPVRFPEVGKRIKEIRGKKTQEQFIEEIGIEQQRYLSSYEKGKFLAKNALVLCKVATQDPHHRGLYWLLTGQEEPSPPEVSEQETFPAPDSPYSLEARQTARFWRAVIFQAPNAQQQHRVMRWRRLLFDIVDMVMEELEETIAEQDEQLVSPAEESSVVAEMLDRLKSRDQGAEEYQAIREEGKTTLEPTLK